MAARISPAAAHAIGASRTAGCLRTVMTSCSWGSRYLSTSAGGLPPGDISLIPAAPLVVYREFRNVAMEPPAFCSKPRRLWTVLPAAAGWVKRYHARNTTTAQPRTFFSCMVNSYADTSDCQPSLAQSDYFTNPLTCTDTVP